MSSPECHVTLRQHLFWTAPSLDLLSGRSCSGGNAETKDDDAKFEELETMFVTSANHYYFHKYEGTTGNRFSTWYGYEVERLFEADGVTQRRGGHLGHHQGSALGFNVKPAPLPPMTDPYSHNYDEDWIQSPIYAASMEYYTVYRRRSYLYWDDQVGEAKSLEKNLPKCGREYHVMRHDCAHLEDVYNHFSHIRKMHPMGCSFRVHVFMTMLLKSMTQPIMEYAGGVDFI